MHKLLFITAFSFIAALLINCNSSKNSNQGNFNNPNGNSELALLMREMYKNGELVKAQVLQGEEFLSLDEFAAIHTAEPTVENKRTPTFTGFAKYYQQTIRDLKAVDKEGRKEKYSLMVDACMRCHESFCPGPRIKISKLYLPNFKRDTH